MPAGLVKRAIEQSTNRGPFVRAIALLSGARVLAEGLAIAEGLPLDARRLRRVLDDAVRYGALADSEAAIALFRQAPPDESRTRRRSTGTMLVQALAKGGKIEVALELLEDLSCETGGAGIIIHMSPDLVVQRRAMMAARARWRALRPKADPVDDPFSQHEFYSLFATHWRKLDAGEAESWLDEILQALESDPALPTNATFGERVHFHSLREAHLFEILDVLRELKAPEQVAGILRAYPKVEEAAEVYPLGLESLRSELPAKASGSGYMVAGSSQDRGLMEGMRAAQKDEASAVQQLLAEARRLHREDLNPEEPNLAPHVFWPACHAYKVAMYWAGKKSGMDAEPLLDQIPDTDFAILAGIELAAGTLGLDQPFGVRMTQHANRYR
jgi:hypothetical protein